MVGEEDEEMEEEERREIERQRELEEKGKEEEEEKEEEDVFSFIRSFLFMQGLEGFLSCSPPFSFHPFLFNSPPHTNTIQIQYKRNTQLTHITQTTEEKTPTRTLDEKKDRNEVCVINYFITLSHIV